ncbi:MAG: SDR family oxidoreductase [Pseudomonadota bacterium]
MSDLAGKTLFVSGGSQGIGLAVARRLASNGANVFLAASDAERLAAAADGIARDYGVNVAWSASDLRDLANCEAAAQQALERFEACDILVNAAGATKGGLFPDQPDADMVDGFALKFYAAVRLSRALWPALTASNGTVINIVGGFARTPAADFMVGGAVNAALANFTKALAEQGLRDDVNVNWIHPGLTVTERLQRIFADRAAQQQTSPEEIECAALASEGLRRLGQPEDVANLVAYLCSPEARHIHGTGISVDGGGSRGYY